MQKCVRSSRGGREIWCGGGLETCPTCVLATSSEKRSLKEIRGESGRTDARKRPRLGARIQAVQKVYSKVCVKMLRQRPWSSRRGAEGGDSRRWWGGGQEHKRPQQLLLRRTTSPCRALTAC